MVGCFCRAVSVIRKLSGELELKLQLIARTHVKALMFSGYIGRTAG